MHSLKLSILQARTTVLLIAILVALGSWQILALPLSSIANISNRQQLQQQTNSSLFVSNSAANNNSHKPSLANTASTYAVDEIQDSSLRDNNNEHNKCMQCYEATEDSRNIIASLTRALKLRKRHLTKQGANSIPENSDTVNQRVLSQLNSNVSIWWRESCKSLDEMQECLTSSHNYCVGDLQFHSLDIFMRQWQLKLKCSQLDNRQQSAQLTTSSPAPQPVLRPFSELTRSLPSDTKEKPRPYTPPEEISRRLEALLPPTRFGSGRKDSSSQNPTLDLSVFSSLPKTIKNLPNSSITPNGIEVNGKILFQMPQTGQRSSRQPTTVISQTTTGNNNNRTNYHNSMYVVQQVILIAFALSMLTFVLAVGYSIRSARQKFIKMQQQQVSESEV